jgi:hypothetical protein
MSAPAINFSQIRSHRSSQNTAFEELTRQLVLASPPSNMTQIEHRGAGADGGVEVLAHLADGTALGWQSKYFLDGFGTSQASQLKDSLSSALSSYPSLTAYYVAIPRNLSGSGVGHNDDARKRWVDFVDWAKKAASDQGRTVDIVLWDETELVRQLTQASNPYPGILAYWFDVTALSPEWFSEKFSVACADLGDRYSPQDHVDVRVGRHFDTIRRNGAYVGYVQRYIADVKAALDAVNTFDAQPYDADIAKTIETLTPLVEEQYRIVTGRDWILDPRIDLRDDFHRGERIYEVARPLLRWKSEDQGLVYRLRKIDQLLETIIRPSYEIAANSLAEPNLLLMGEAGSGKSHILAHAVQHHLKDGGAAVLMLGQYFSAGDPWTQLATKLGLANRRQDEVLGALQSAALATGLPAIIAIDAINEAEVSAIWRNHLSGLLSATRRASRIRGRCGESRTAILG